MARTGITWRTLFLIFLLCAGITFCKECQSSNEGNVLQPGHAYHYVFKTEAFGEAVGTTNDRTRMTIECQVKVTHSYDCYYSLKLGDCRLNAIGGPQEDEKAWIHDQELAELARYPVSFSLVNGAIESVFTDANDPIFYVNIKRGILSSFVFKLRKSFEKANDVITDIHGRCPVEYLAVDDSSVKMSKDMMNCAFPSRPDWQFSPWSMFWNMSFIQYQMNSTVNCDYKLNRLEKHLDGVNCHERHAIGLESTHRTTTAVQTNIYYQLNLIKSERVDENAHNKKLPDHRTGIQFEYEHTPDPSKDSQPQNFLAVSQEMLSELVETSQEEIRLFTIPKFNDFVAWLRSSYDILPFIETVRDCSFLTKPFSCEKSVKDLAMSYLSDALVQCNTVPCFKAIADLAINKEISETYLNFVIYSWTNMHFTKPEIIPHIMAICKHKDSRFCWLSLGTIVKRFHRTTRHSSKQLADQARDVIEHFSENIGHECQSLPTFVSDEERDDHMLTYLKAIGNSGEAFLQYSSLSESQLLKCVNRKDLHTFLRIASIEALSKLGLCDHNTELCDSVHNELEPLLKNESVSVDLRLAAYSYLIQRPKRNFEHELIQLLSKEKNSQILSFIVTDLKNRFDDIEYRNENRAFVQQLMEFFEQDDQRFEVNSSNDDDDDGLSFSSAIGRFHKIPSLPENLQGFGAKLLSTVVYPFYNIPHRFQSKVVLQLFNKVIDFLTVGVKIEGWQKTALVLQKYLSRVEAVDSIEEFNMIIQDVIEELFKKDPASNKYYGFDDKIIKNINKIYETYADQHKSLEHPFLDVYLEMFGNTLNYISLQDLPEALSSYSLEGLLESLANGIVYNNTRVIRVIEAYNQVPTMMGLPLNWTTNATLAFSIRSGLRIDFQKVGFHGSGFFQPSAALTFLNRMVLDFPLHTQIGIQANSSVYTSTQLKATYSSTEGVRNFNIEAPQTPQKILELFRTNQIIKHDSYTDIPDWDIERTSVDWCTSDVVNSVLGLSVCHERSYPNVTHRMKPWALMAGSCKWRLELLPHDGELKSYNIALEETVPSENTKKFTLKLNAPGKSLKREVAIEVLYNFKNQGFGIKVKVPDLPDFAISVSRNALHEGKQFIGYWDVLLLKISDSLKYQLTQNQENRVQAIKSDHTDSNSSRKGKRKFALSVQKRLELSTPFNDYVYTKTMHILDDTIKASVTASYENKHPRHNYLADLIEPSFWESESKAVFQMQFDMNRKSRQLSGNMSTPHWHIDLSLVNITMDSGSKIIFNLTKTETATEKLLSFVKFTYRQSQSTVDEDTKSLHSFNLTIPRKSWGLRVENLGHAQKYSSSYIFTKNRMLPRHADAKVDWWTEDVDDNLTLEQTEYKLLYHIENQSITKEKLFSVFGDIREKEIDDLQNNYILADVSLYYPSVYRTEAVKFDGKFLISVHPAKVGRFFRFQKDFVLLSTYNNLQLTSHSVVRTDADANVNEPIRSIVHNSFFTNTESQTQAFYNMDLKLSQNQYDCVEITFNHKISSHVYNMASNVSYLCIANNNQQHHLLLNLDSHSTYWNALDMQIRQTIKDVRPSYSVEEMNFDNPYMHINVTATWDGNNHRKNAVFTALPANEKFLVINRHAVFPVSNFFDVLIPGSGSDRRIVYKSQLSENKKKLKMDLWYPDSDHKILRLQNNIITPEDRIWKFEVYPGWLNFSKYLREVKMKMASAFAGIASDPNHPLNKMLEPAMKMPLLDYLSHVKQEWHNKLNTILDYSEELHSLEPFVEPFTSFASNILSKISNRVFALYDLAEKKSITLWAINYFNVPQSLNAVRAESLNPFSERCHKFSEERDEMAYKYPLWSGTWHTGQYFKWNGFNSAPTWNMEQFLKDFNFGQKEITEIRHKQMEDGKIGMIFGPRHVYTFDGQLFEVPAYPSADCAYLLAHDAYGSQFSAVAYQEYLHILFSNSSVSISSENLVFFNKVNIPLPFESPDNAITVTQEGHVIVIKSPTLTVFCEGQSLLCILQITIFNGGGILGLLGNADGESFNDFMLPNGRVTEDIMEFVQSYEISGLRVCKNVKKMKRPSYVDEDTRPCSQSVANVCAAYDHLRNDFRQVCEVYAEEDQPVCYTETALAALCYYKEQQMNTQCYVQAQRNPQVQHEMEVVFVIDQQQSMLDEGQSSSSFLKGIDKIAGSLNHQFTKNGFSSIQYSLVGFGGAGVRHEPSVHSLRGGMWVQYSDVNELLLTLKFKGTVPYNPVLAVKYAAEVLGHDTFNVKVFVIITRNDQQTSEKTTLDFVQQSLEQNSITMYTIGSYPSIEKGKKVYGVRADGLLFPTSEKGEDFLDYPSGDLAKLTSATRGSLFLKRFLSSSGPALYFEEFAKEIYAKVRRETERCRNCKTVRSGWWYYQNECRILNC